MTVLVESDIRITIDLTKRVKSKGTSRNYESSYKLAAEIQPENCF